MISKKYLIMQKCLNHDLDKKFLPGLSTIFFSIIEITETSLTLLLLCVSIRNIANDCPRRSSG